MKLAFIAVNYNNCYISANYVANVKAIRNIENHKLDIEIIKFSDIDYNRLAYKYSNMSFEQIRDLFGDDFCTLSFNSRKLLERYFAGPV